MTDITPFRGRGRKDLTQGFKSGGDDGGKGISRIPPIPTHCGNPDCHNEATVIRVLANAHGATNRLYSFSQVCSKSGDNMRANDGVTFVAWKSWCSKCYMNLAVKTGQSSHPSPDNFTWG